MKQRKVPPHDDLLLAHLSNKLASYHQVIRDNFNYGNNTYLLDFNHANWLFDPGVKPIYHLAKNAKIRWFSSVNPFSVFVASEGINPLNADNCVQRTGVCLIESAEIRLLTNKATEGSFLSEKEAIGIMDSYPSESQIMGVKPVMNSAVVVYLEDVLFEELWNRFTGGMYSKSQPMQGAFRRQIERTKSAVKKYVTLLHPDDCPAIRFINYSDIWSGLQTGVNSWIDALLEQTPYVHGGEEKFYVPNAAFVLYTYGGENLAKISGFDAGKEIVLVRELSHCVLEKSWTKNKSLVMDWFRDAVVSYYQRNPKPVVGYLDLFDNQAGCSYKDTPLEEKVSFGNAQAAMLAESVNKPFPLWENKLFQRGVMCDFDPDVLDAMLQVGLVNSSYVYSGRPQGQKGYVKYEMQKGLRKIHEKFVELILPLFG